MCGAYWTGAGMSACTFSAVSLPVVQKRSRITGSEPRPSFTNDPARRCPIEVGARSSSSQLSEDP